MAEKIKVLTICGTRPEIIRLSEIIKKLDIYTKHILVNTNQSYDYEMSQVFFNELEIRKPDYTLEVKSESLGGQIGNIFAQCEKVIWTEKPDALLILGDTNSALACIMAKRMKVIIFHMEAGNRCFDERVPEEINRRIVDHTSDINLCYTEHSRRHLLNEGFAPQDIFVVGSPLTEVYTVNKENIENSGILDKLGLKHDEYLLASIHREENVDNGGNLRSIMESLCLLSDKYSMQVIFPMHPRTRDRIEYLGIKRNDKIVMHKPFGMLDYIKLQLNAFCNLSDSGTIHEDAAIFGFSAVNVRESNERPEVYDTGNVIMAGVGAGTILEAVSLVRNQLDSGVVFGSPYDYISHNCSDKVVRLIVGHTKIMRKRKYYI